jgi:hypothetical protein
VFISKIEKAQRYTKRKAKQKQEQEAIARTV